MTEPNVGPNVILIVSDDHGYADRRATGHHPDVHTPALDRLAAQGVSCSDAYVTAPICSPSRAAIISGAYQQRWGAMWFGSSRFPDERSSLAERFAELGYATGYFGKVHYGPEERGDRACPPHHGFADTYYGLAGQQQGRLNYLHHSRAAVEEYGAEASWRMAVQPMLAGDTEVELDGHLTGELGQRVRGFVDDHPTNRSLRCSLSTRYTTSAGNSRLKSWNGEVCRSTLTGRTPMTSPTPTGTTGRSVRVSSMAGSITWPNWS
jgi:hypothetical protein